MLIDHNQGFRIWLIFVAVKNKTYLQITINTVKGLAYIDLPTGSFCFPLLPISFTKFQNKTNKAQDIISNSLSFT